MPSEPTHLRQRVTGISAGILAAAPGDLALAARQLAANGGRIAHFDVMDGVFVPQMTAGPAFLAVAVAAGLLCDVHLMVARPSAQVDAFARAAADILTIHAEAPDAAEAIAAVRAASARLNRPILAGLAIMPGTPLDSLAPLLALAPDLVLVLAVDPRDGSPADVEAAAARVRALRARVPVGTLIAIDGGITTRTIDTAAAAAPDVIVSGSAIFAADDPAQALGRLTDGWTAGQVFASTDRAGGGT